MLVVERNEIHSGEKYRSGMCVNFINFIIFLTDYYRAIYESATSGDRTGCPELDNQTMQEILHVRRRDNVVSCQDPVLTDARVCSSSGY